MKTHVSTIFCPPSRSQRVKTSLSTGERETPLLGTSGTVWGTALVPQEEGRGGTKKAGGCGGGVVTNPVFVSIGHRVSLETSVALTKAVGRYEVCLFVMFCTVSLVHFARRGGESC